MSRPEIRYCVLGPLEILVDGVRLPIGGPKIKAVLAALLVQEGAEVTADGLVDLVWGEAPPPTVRTSLQVHISKIRSAFATAGVTNVLLTRGSGYRLLVNPDELDVAMFRRLVADGRDLLARGSLQESQKVVDDALRLWRGDPLALIDLPGLAPGVLRAVEDLRVHALVLRAEAQLSLGRHSEALPDLLRIRSQHPLDERICELTCLALFRSGRQADALGELATLRREFSQQLGMEPGPALAALEQGILTNDGALHLTSDSGSEPRRSRKTVSVLALRLPSGDPEDVVAATRAVSELFEGAVANLGGWCPPASAGRLVAVFGVPVVHEDDAERAIRTADALKRAAGTLGLEARLGVSTGEVLVEVGRETRLLTHDPVEVADLLARKARPGEVLIGVATYRLVKSVATVDSAQLLVLDDEEAPFVAHSLRDVALAGTKTRLAAPMVGRDSDLLRLRDAAQRAVRDRRPTLLAVLGSAGLGKSRLVEAFLAGLGDRVDIAVVRCPPYGKDVGLFPVADVVRSVVGIGEGRAGVTTLRKLERFTTDEPDGEVLAELLGALLGISRGHHTRDETFWAIRRCLEIASSRQPLVIVLEDLQWAEESLLDLIGYLAATTRSVPLVLVCTSRPELDERPAWGGVATDTVTVRLDPLNPSEMNTLVVALLGDEELDIRLRERIVAAAEGNPLFLEEILGVLIDEGRLTRRSSRWELTSDLAVLPIPPTVKAVLDARVDLLPAPERDALEAAAIAGREFNMDDLADLRPEADPDSMSEVLESLCRRGLLDVDRFATQGSSAYAFRHLLIRDVAYGAIPRDRRAHDHERLGRGLADRAGDRPTDHEEVVGRHLEIAFHLAGDKGMATQLGLDAASHLEAAGRRAFALDDSTAADGLFERAAACATGDHRRTAELARLRGAALFDLGRFGEAQQVLSVGLEESRSSGDAALQWRLELELVELDVYTRPQERAASETESFAQQAVEALQALGDLAGLARAYRLLGEALTLQGRLDDGIEAFEEGARLARLAGDEREIALPQQLMALHGSTPLPVFIAHCEQLAARRGRRPRPEVVMRLAYARALCGDEAGARKDLGQGLALARDVGGSFRVADAELYAGLTSLALGDSEDAVRLLAKSAERLAGIGEGNLRSTVEGFLGEALWRVGRLGDAMAAVARCRELAAEDDSASQLLWRQVEAKVQAHRGEVAEALDLMAEAVVIADQTDFSAMAAAVHLDAAVLHDAVGDSDQAQRERQVAVQLLSRKGVASPVLASGNSA